MSFENPENIIRSWNVQTNFASGPVVADRLVPPQYGRIRTPFCQVWREETLGTTLNWESKNFSVYLPESLRVVSSIYLRLQLAAPDQNFKAYPGLYAIKTIRLLSAGQEVYTCDYFQFMVDHMQQMRDQEARDFAKAYLGYEASPSTNARDVMLPILLFNSQYLMRSGADHRGHGVLPCFLGQNRLEIQITMNHSKNLLAAVGTVPTISGKCSFMYHEVKMTPANLLSFSDARGKYSIVTRRFTELTSGWQHYETADTKATWNINQPQGIVTEVQLLAVANNADETRHTAAYLRPTKFKIIADSIVQKDLDTKNKVDAELWVNGFVENSDFPQPGRLCFAAHASENNHTYSGGYNMQLASTITYEFEFNVACRYKIIAVQLQRVRIDQVGRVTASLD